MRFPRAFSLGLLLAAVSSCGQAPRFDSARAFEHLKAQVAFGPRIPGSEAHRKARAYIVKELQSIGGLQIEEDPFVAKTPKGEYAMANVLATLPGSSKEFVLLASHYDTKDIGTPPCPGANDGASTSGLLIELARSLAAAGPHRMTLRFAFFDGEEAFVEWSEEDSLYGSRHLVGRWSKERTIESLRAMILFDLVGDADLGVIRESLSTGWLVEIFREAAKELGHSRHFFQSAESIEDDHRPFLAAGIPAINIFDASYGPRRGPGLGEYWHSPKDTVERCSAESLRIVGETGLRAVEKIQARFKK